MTQKYTSAPWFYEQTMTHIVDGEIAGKSFTVFSSSNKKIGIAHIYTKDKNDTLLNDYRYEFDEAENNANLIAVAPELLEALQSMIEMFDTVSGKVDWGKSFLNADAIQKMNEAPIQARAAIAKAKGEA